MPAKISPVQPGRETMKTSGTNLEHVFIVSLPGWTGEILAGITDLTTTRAGEPSRWHTPVQPGRETMKTSGTNLEHARVHNRRVIIEAVRLHGRQLGAGQLAM
jgi:hypothetical protein